MNIRRLATACLALVLLTGPLAAQTPVVPPATQAALEARRAELNRIAKEGVEAAAARAKANPLPMPGQIRVTVGNIGENRTVTASGTLNVPLVIFSEEIPPLAIVRRHEITRAIDDKDRALVSSQPNPVAGMASLANPAGRGTAPSVTRNLSLQAAARDAREIKLLEGHLEFFVPSDENGALAKVNGLGALAGKPIELPVLAANEIELTFLTKEMFDAMKPQWGNAAAATGTQNFTTSVFFLLKDPKGRLVSIDIADAAGTRIIRGAATRTTNIPSLFVAEAQIGAALPADAILTVAVETPESIRTYPFRFENLALP